MFKRLNILALIVATVLVFGCTPKPEKKSNAAVPKPAAAQTTTTEQPTPTGAQPAEQTAEAVWTCPMHPEVRESKPGKCPKCGMDLVKAEPAKPAQGPESK